MCWSITESYYHDLSLVTDILWGLSLRMHLHIPPLLNLSGSLYLVGTRWRMWLVDRLVWFGRAGAAWLKDLVRKHGGEGCQVSSSISGLSTHSNRGYGRARSAISRFLQISGSLAEFWLGELLHRIFSLVCSALNVSLIFYSVSSDESQGYADICPTQISSTMCCVASIS